VGQGAAPVAADGWRLGPGLGLRVRWQDQSGDEVVEPRPGQGDDLFR